MICVLPLRTRAQSPGPLVHETLGQNPSVGAEEVEGLPAPILRRDPKSWLSPGPNLSPRYG